MTVCHVFLFLLHQILHFFGIPHTFLLLIVIIAYRVILPTCDHYQYVLYISRLIISNQHNTLYHIIHAHGIPFICKVCSFDFTTVIQHLLSTVYAHLTIHVCILQAKYRRLRISPHKASACTNVNFGNFDCIRCEAYVVLTLTYDDLLDDEPVLAFQSCSHSWKCCCHCCCERVQIHCNAHFLYRSSLFRDDVLNWLLIFCFYRTFQPSLHATVDSAWVGSQPKFTICSGNSTDTMNFIDIAPYFASADSTESKHKLSM